MTEVISYYGSAPDMGAVESPPSPQISGTDTGSGVDTAVVSLRVTSSDANIASPQNGILVAKPTSVDASGPTTEVADYRLILSSADLGQAVDTGLVTLSVSSADFGSGLEDQARVGKYTSQDQNTSVVEISSSKNNTTVTDSGAVSEDQLKNITIVDLEHGFEGNGLIVASIIDSDANGQLTETGVVSFGVPKTSSDVGASSDVETLRYIAATQTDSGTGTDSAIRAVANFSADLGTDSETSASTAQILAIGFNNVTDESIFVAAELPSSDLGSGDDTLVTLKISVPDIDAGTGTSSEILNKAIVGDSDAGAFGETASVLIVFNDVDAGNALEVATLVINFVQGDSAQTAEAQIVAIGIQDLDQGFASELTKAGLADSDFGGSLDAQDLLSNFILADSGHGTDKTISSVQMEILPDAPELLLSVGLDDAQLISTKVSV